MQSQTNFATTALVVLWIVTGALFGDLSFMGIAPPQQAAPAPDRVHSEPVTVRSTASAHG